MSKNGGHNHGHNHGHHGWHPGHGAEAGPPEGWYYFGPQPPWAAAAHGTAPDTAQLKEAFDDLSRGEVNAETLGKLFALDDRHFWKGAVVGAGVVLALSNLPTIKAFMAMAAASAGQAMNKAPGRAGEASADRPADGEETEE